MKKYIEIILATIIIVVFAWFYRANYKAADTTRNDTKNSTTQRIGNIEVVYPNEYDPSNRSLSINVESRAEAISKDESPTTWDIEQNILNNIKGPSISVCPRVNFGTPLICSLYSNPNLIWMLITYSRSPQEAAIYKTYTFFANNNRYTVSIYEGGASPEEFEHNLASDKLTYIYDQIIDSIRFVN